MSSKNMQNFPPPQRRDKENLTQRDLQNKKPSSPKGLRRLAVLLSGLLVVLVIGWIGIQVYEQPSAAGESSSPSPSAPASVVGGEVASVAPAPSGEIDPDSWNQVGPVPAAQENNLVINPDFRMIALPENGRVEMSYFDTVTFVGDSITQGLELYSQGIPNAHYCAYKSISPKAIYDGSEWPRSDGEREIPLDALVASQPDNVYVLLGANAMGGMQDDALIEYYRTMLQKMRESLLPGVSIYVQTITPVRPDSKFDMARITALNNRLAQLAYEEGVYFLDLNETLAGDDGYLREDFAGKDGIHLSPAGYAAWVEYLVTHTAYNARNPYMVGSPYYTPTPLPESVAEGEQPPEG